LDFEDNLHCLFAILVGMCPETAVAVSSYQQVCVQLGLKPWSTDELSKVNFVELEQSLLALNNISYFWRRSILQSCADIIQSDGRVAFKEYEALRVIAECLSSPLPVLMMELEQRDYRDDPIPFE